MNEKQKGTLQTCLSPAWGGLEMVAYEFAQKLKSQGHFVTTVCLKDSPLAKELKNSNLDVIEVKRGSKYFAPACIRQIRAALQTGRYNSVLVQQMFELFQVVPALRGMKDIVVVGISHTFLNFAKKDWIHRKLYARLDKLIALTDIHKRNLLEFLPVREDTIEILPNAVDLEKFNPKHRNNAFRAEFAPAAPGLLIGVIARLDLGKGVREVVQVASRLRELGVKFRIVMVGRETIGEEGAKATLENEIKQRGLQDEVLLIGHRSDIQSVIASLDILLMPSPFETFGRVLIEAMASGVAVVASGGGGVPDIVINKKNGILTPPLSVEDMAQGIAAYARDPNLRESMALNGLKSAEELYDFRKVDDKLYRLLEV